MNRRSIAISIALVASAAFAVHAQQQGTAPPAPPPSPVICRVEGRPITQADFDRVGQPYFERLKSEMKDNFTPEVQRIANRNVLDELVRREMLVVEAARQKIQVSETETDRILEQDPFFFTNGQFDRAKFVQYKISPGANYMTILPKLRELAASNRLDSLVRARCMPAAAEVRAEWSKRNDQVRFKFLPISLRDISLDPEASEAELAAYYAAHPDQFERKGRVRLRYARWSLPAPGDSLRTRAERDSLERAKTLAERLRRGGSIDSLVSSPSGPLDTGLFDVPVGPRNPLGQGGGEIPGIGAVPELANAIAHADSDTTIRVVGPFVAPDAVVVGVVSERSRRGIAPMREVMADLKRRADAEKRRVHQDEERTAYYAAHRDSLRTARIHFTRVLLKDPTPAPRAPAPKDIEAWYAGHGRALFGGTLPESALLPGLTDSLRAVARDRMMSEARSAAVERSLAGIASAWSGGRDPRALARTAGAVVETLTLVRGANDTLFTPGLLDSTFEAHRVGSIGGPRMVGERGVLWRVDSWDDSFVPPFDQVRPRIERALFEDKRRQDEVDARAFFDAHRADFKTPTRYVIQYVEHRVPAADSVKVPEVEIKKYYDAHRASFRHEEEVRARHILLGTRPGQMSDPAARRLADSLRAEIVKGADFATLAKSFSADPGSAANGGDLGFFARGRMVQEFSDTSFALKPGRVSQPVKTAYGYHLIKIEAKRAAGFTPLSEVRNQIVAQLGSAIGDSSAVRAARATRRRLAAVGATEAMATRLGVKTSAEFASNEPLPGIGFVQGLAQDLDHLPVGKWAPKTYRAGSMVLVIKPIKKAAPRQAEFDEVKTRAIEDMKTAKKKEILAQRVSAVRAALATGAPLDSVAAPYGGSKDSGPLTRAMIFVPTLGAEKHLVESAFTFKKTGVSDTVTTSQGVAWFQVEGRSTQQGSSFAKDAPAIRQELQLKAYNDWVEKKKKTLRVEILRADLREVPPPITKTITVGGGG